MTDPEKRCSTCGTPKCNDCASFWSPRKPSPADHCDGADDAQKLSGLALKLDAELHRTRARLAALVGEHAFGARKAKEATTVTAFEYYDGDACMDACRLACRGRTGIEGHLVASAIQYLWRSGRKGPALPDLLKARDMVNRLVRELGGGK